MFLFLLVYFMKYLLHDFCRKGTNYITVSIRSTFPGIPMQLTFINNNTIPDIHKVCVCSEEFHWSTSCYRTGFFSYM